MTNSTDTKILTLIWLIIVYLLLKYTIPFGNYVIYPINLFVTFLHELWHSLAAILTWWWVKSLEINSNWSWFAVTSGWFRPIVLMWGYIWSAIFWNILFYIWMTNKKLSENVIFTIAFAMIFVAIFWFNSIFSSVILLLLAWGLIFIALKTKLDSILLQFLWLASVLFIIEDFRIWPSSDLAKFSDIFIIIPQFIWMILWLVIVLLITYFNIKRILKK